jgi:2-polyprenyl-3-methyl-5-hydroxy-6-metoxy-1,4-benzoquinol methylase
MGQGKQYTDQLTETHDVCLSWIKPRTRILELGCHTGVLSRALIQRGCIVTGIELSESAAVAARLVCDQVICGDLESAETWDSVVGPYDAVICTDVLEHLKNPEAVLSRIRPLLGEQGSLIVALPNIAHYTIRLALLRGHFDYTEFGILDSTHLRFFTRNSALRLLRGAGYEVREFKGNVAAFRGDDMARRMGLWWAKSRLNRLAIRLFPDASVFKWCFLANGRPTSAPDATPERAAMSR